MNPQSSPVTALLSANAASVATRINALLQETLSLWRGLPAEERKHLDAMHLSGASIGDNLTRAATAASDLASGEITQALIAWHQLMKNRKKRWYLFNGHTAIFGDEEEARAFVAAARAIGATAAEFQLASRHASAAKPQPVVINVDDECADRLYAASRGRFLANYEVHL